MGKVYKAHSWEFRHFHLLEMLLENTSPHHVPFSVTCHLNIKHNYFKHFLF